MIKHTIYGKPKALKRHRSTRSGIMYDPSYIDKKKIWLQIASKKPVQPYAGNIKISLKFVMPRPKSHYRTGKFKYKLKEKLKNLKYHTFTPDLDNLIKLISDVISGKDRFIVDDSQICIIEAEKIYGETPRTEFIIQEFI